MQPRVSSDTRRRVRRPVPDDDGVHEALTARACLQLLTTKEGFSIFGSVFLIALFRVFQTDTKWKPSLWGMAHIKKGPTINIEKSIPSFVTA